MAAISICMFALATRANGSSFSASAELELKEMSLGGYPGFSLKEARERAAAARALAKAGVDPLTARREAKIKEACAKPFRSIRNPNLSTASRADSRT